MSAKIALKQPRTVPGEKSLVVETSPNENTLVQEAMIDKVLGENALIVKQVEEEPAP